MKISELINVLTESEKEFGDIEVITTWEGITNTISESNIYYVPPQNKLFIDADGNFYMDEFINGDKEDSSILNHEVITGCVT